MLPQLSYVVAQAGVDSRPPPMLPRLTKPFYANGDSTMTSTTSSLTGASGLDRSQYTPSYYMRPGSSPPPHPPLLPLPTNTSSSASSASTLTTAATLSSPYVYPSSSTLSNPSSTTNLGNTNKIPCSSVTGPDTARAGHSFTPKQRKQQLSPSMATNPSTVSTTTSSSSPYSSTQYRQQQQASIGSSGYSQQASIPYASTSTVYPTYQSSDPSWPHRVTAPFVEPGKSSSSSPSTNSYATTFPTYTTSTQSITPASSSSLDYHHSTRQPYQQQHKSKQQKKQQQQQQQQHQFEYQYQNQQELQPVSDQQRHRPRGFMVPDNSIIQDNMNEIHHYSHPPTTLDYHHQQAYGNTSYTAASRRMEHLKEWNQLLTWMDHEFWEQSEEIYHEKLSSLQQELKSLQNDTHVPFRDLVSDLELKRETMIADAECFLNYQLEWMEQLYEEDVAIIEEEYNNKQRHLQDAILAVIEDRKKQVKEEKDDHLNEKDLIGEAYSRVTNKRTLRKRPPTEHSRNDSRKRHARHAASLQTDTNSSLGKEEEELEDELEMMKTNLYSL